MEDIFIPDVEARELCAVVEPAGHRRRVEKNSRRASSGAGHQRRVSRLSTAIAREMGLSEDQIRGIREAGDIHDIGKISVPAEILSKPGTISVI